MSRTAAASTIFRITNLRIAEIQIDLVTLIWHSYDKNIAHIVW